MYIYKVRNSSQITKQKQISQKNHINKEGIFHAIMHIISREIFYHVEHHSHGNLQNSLKPGTAALPQACSKVAKLLPHDLLVTVI